MLSTTLLEVGGLGWHHDVLVWLELSKRNPASPRPICARMILSALARRVSYVIRLCMDIRPGSAGLAPNLGIE